jgi:hypothetical protein
MSRPGQNKGTLNFKNRLSEDQVLAIYANKDSTQEELAQRYRVSQSTISHIKNGLTWAWLTQAKR